MRNNYQFELVFLKLQLKRPPLSDNIFRVTLLQKAKELTPDSIAFQTEQIKIKRAQKIVDLDGMTSFKFVANKLTQSSAFVIKYQLKGTNISKEESIPINPMKMIHQIQTNEKTVFQELHEGERADVSYKFYVTKPQAETIKLLLVQQTQEQKLQPDFKRSNSISRSKRPPELNLSKKNGTPASSKNKLVRPPEAMLGLVAAAVTDNQGLITLQPPNLNKIGVQSYQSRDSIVEHLQKKIESLPISQIQKVNQLIATHHKPKEVHHDDQTVSYKLKIVISLLLIGIGFLLYDTLSDRSSRLKTKIIVESTSKTQQKKGKHQQKIEKPNKKQKVAKRVGSKGGH